MLANLAQVMTMLERGVIVVIEPQRMRVRMLPISSPRDRSAAEGQ